MFRTNGYLHILLKNLGAFEAFSHAAELIYKNKKRQLLEVRIIIYNFNFLTSLFVEATVQIVIKELFTTRCAQ